MAKVLQVRGVPETIHETLVRHAEEEGLSLNRYMLRELEHLARRADNAAIMRRAARRPGPRLSAEQVVAAVREDRERDA